MASNSADVDDEDPPMMPLHDCASCLIGFTHAIYEKIKALPFPIGTAIRICDAISYPVLHELIESLECRYLNILSCIDHEVLLTLTSAKKCVCATASNFKSASRHVRKRGFIGASADFWIKYEALIKQEVEMAFHLADKIPGANLVSPLLCSLSTPLVSAICDWLLEQSSGKEVGIDHNMEAYGSQNMSYEDCDISWKEQYNLWKEKNNLFKDKDKDKDKDVSCDGQEIDGSPIKNIDHSFTVSPIKNMDYDFTFYPETPVKNMERSLTVCAESPMMDHSPHDADVSVCPQHAEEIENGMTSHLNGAEEIENGMTSNYNGNLSIDTSDIIMVEEEPVLIKEDPVPHVTNEKNENSVPDILEIFDSAWLLGKF